MTTNHIHHLNPPGLAPFKLLPFWFVLVSLNINNDDDNHPTTNNQWKATTKQQTQTQSFGGKAWREEADSSPLLQIKLSH